MDGRNHWSMDQPTARILWGLESQLKGLSHEATNSTHDLTSLGDVSDWTGCISEKNQCFFLLLLLVLVEPVFFCCCCCCCCCCWMGGKRSIAINCYQGWSLRLCGANSCIDVSQIKVWGRCICPVQLQWWDNLCFMRNCNRFDQTGFCVKQDPAQQTYDATLCQWSKCQSDWLHFHLCHMGCIMTHHSASLDRV